MDLLGALNPAQGQAQQEARKQAWTQQQIEYANEIARQLNQSSSDRSPIYSPWAGAARMADALVGGMTGMKALQMQRQNMATAAGALPDPTGGSQGASPDMTGGQAPSGDTVPRGIRNNNPGNIEDGSFARSLPGYSGTDGRFARFDTPENGMHAIDGLLTNYGQQGINTVNGVISRWAPASDGNNVSAYANHVATGLGVGPNDKIDLTDPSVREHMAQHIATFENGVGPMTRVAQARGWLGGDQQAPQGAAPVTQGSPQGAQNGPPATQAAAAPQTAVATPQGQQAPQGFLPPVPGLPPLPQMAKIRELMITNPQMAMQLYQQLQQAVAPQVIKTPDGHTYVGNQYTGFHLSPIPAAPNIEKFNYEVNGIKGEQPKALTFQNGQPVYQTIPTQGPPGQPGAQGAQNSDEFPANGSIADQAAWARRQSILGEGQKALQSESNKVYQGALGLGTTGAKISALTKDALQIVQDPSWASGGLGPTRMALDRLAASMGKDPGKAKPRELMDQANGLLKNYLQEALKSGNSVLGENAPRIFQTEVETIEHMLPDQNDTAEGMAAKLQAMNRLGIHWSETADKLDEYVRGRPGGIPDIGVNKLLRDQESNFHMYFPDQKAAAAAQTGETPAQPLGVGESKPFGGGTLKRVQ